MHSTKTTNDEDRPPLPSAFANDYLKTIDPATPPAVKFQIITREGQDITVGRIKIYTPGNSHAFILRRFDTGALSLTTMFRAAFPGAGDELEKVESNWVKASFEAPGTNGTSSGRLRLAGTWITPEAALAVAPDYNLQHVVPALISASADDSATYRRSTKAGDSPAPKPAPPVSPNAPNKRARQSSPQPAAAPALVPPATPATRASARIRSPARATPPRGTRASRGTPSRATPARGTRNSTAATPIRTDPVDDDDAPDVTGPDPEQDILESKALVHEIMSQQAARTGLSDNLLKRSADEQRAGELVPLPLLNLDTSNTQVDRPIAGNRRLNLGLNAEQKALAWGTLAFAFGMGVTSFILPLIT